MSNRYLEEAIEETVREVGRLRAELAEVEREAEMWKAARDEWGARADRAEAERNDAREKWFASDARLAELEAEQAYILPAHRKNDARIAKLEEALRTIQDLDETLVAIMARGIARAALADAPAPAPAKTRCAACDQPWPHPPRLCEPQDVPYMEEWLKKNPAPAPECTCDLGPETYGHREGCPVRAPAPAPPEWCACLDGEGVCQYHARVGGGPLTGTAPPAPECTCDDGFEWVKNWKHAPDCPARR